VSTVIDASALIAFLRDEPGADVVENVLSAPDKCYAHALNLCEVYYDFFRASNQDAAEAAISDLLGLGIEDRTDMDSEFWRDPGGLKAVHRRVSLADCCALALARRLGARLVTADRHEFEPILSAGISQIEFIR
jgi:PIN domain nuclease of toxin-antitoxin system